MDWITAVLFLAGLGLLVRGAELLVRGASRLGAALGISPLVIGLTVVGYCTSAPELAVSVKAALSGQADIALGNVVGSNIFNVLFILGGSALIAPLVVSQQLIRVDVPLMIGTSALVYLMGLSGRITRLEGASLFVLALAYTAFAIRQSRKESREVREEYDQHYGATRGSVAVNLALVGGGLALLVLGARWLVNGALAFAQVLGVSELVIGLTIVAAGTSLPEVATSFVAAARGERDIAVGNVVGSNIFNVVIVLGLSAVVSPTGVAVSPAALRFDVPVMIAVAVACLPIFASGYVIARWEGALFFVYYVAYTAYLALESQRHDALPAFSRTMLFFVIPLTVVTLAVVALRSARRGDAGRPAS